MEIEQLQHEAGRFFEWPTEKRDFVTLTSCLLFAQHIAKLERDRCIQVVEGFERNRDWVPESLYGTLRREAAAAIRAA